MLTQPRATFAALYHGRGGRLANAIESLTRSIELVFADVAQRPLWMTSPTDKLLCIAGRYNPLAGRGVVEEVDWGNFTGSVLMLAMIFCCRLQIFGQHLQELALGKQRSGKGPDNRRTNALEAMPNDWQEACCIRALREELQDVWCLTSLACVRLCGDHEQSQDCFLNVLNCADSLLPCGPLDRSEVHNFIDLWALT